jgi:hypothetical protein
MSAAQKLATVRNVVGFLPVKIVGQKMSAFVVLWLDTVKNVIKVHLNKFVMMSHLEKSVSKNLLNKFVILTLEDIEFVEVLRVVVFVTELVADVSVILDQASKYVEMWVTQIKNAVIILDSNVSRSLDATTVKILLIKSRFVAMKLATVMKLTPVPELSIGMKFSLRRLVERLMW